MPIEALEAKAADIHDKPNLSLSDFGDVPSVLSEAAELGRSRFMSVFLRAAVYDLGRSDSPVETALEAFVFHLVSASEHDLALEEAVEVLEQNRLFVGPRASSCCKSLLEVAGSRSRSFTTRAIALEASLRCALESATAKHRLLAHLLGITRDDDADYLVHAAKVLGVSNSYWPETDLVETLQRLTTVPLARAEAAFELGLAQLGMGLAADDRSSVTDHFEQAKLWFDLSLEASEDRPEATLYAETLRLILVYFPKQDRAAAEVVAENIRRSVASLWLYHTPRSTGKWQSTRQTELACWSQLSLRISSLSGELGQPSFWDPRLVIEDFLLAVLQASRTLLGKNSATGLTEVIRPSIVAGMASSRAHRHALSEWLRRNPLHEDAAVALELLAEIDSRAEGGKLSQENSGNGNQPGSGAEGGTGLAADDQILRHLRSAALFHVHRMGAAAIESFEGCWSSLADHPDFVRSRDVQKMVSSVLFWTVRFLEARLNLQRGDDATGAYLFEQQGKLPEEKDLQMDYFRFVYLVGQSAGIEVTNIAGGRADVAFTRGAERVVTEVKREDRDCSFDGIARSYEAQATEYQNTGARLGFLLVLEQCEVRKAGLPHITSLVQVRSVVRADETIPRKLVIVKVPGRRLRPSDLTKAAS